MADRSWAARRQRGGVVPKPGRQQKLYVRYAPASKTALDSERGVVLANASPSITPS